jgi:hypothetical protein
MSGCQDVVTVFGDLTGIIATAIGGWWALGQWRASNSLLVEDQRQQFLLKAQSLSRSYEDVSSQCGKLIDEYKSQVLAHGEELPNYDLTSRAITLKVNFDLLAKALAQLTDQINSFRAFLKSPAAMRANVGLGERMIEAWEAIEPSIKNELSELHQAIYHSSHS